MGTIWEGIRLGKQFANMGSYFSQQEKEGMEKIKLRALTETDFIKDGLNKTGERMG